MIIIKKYALLEYIFHFSYAICVRREAGYCCIEYSLCDGSTASFGISSLDATKAYQDDKCTEDWVGIDGKYLIIQAWELCPALNK